MLSCHHSLLYLPRNAASDDTLAAFVGRERPPLKRERKIEEQRGDDQETENPAGTHPRMTDGIFAYHDRG